MPDPIIDHCPTVIVALGRQRVGKTMLLAALAQFWQARAGQFQVWNADQQNRTHPLSNYVPDVLTVPFGSMADGKVWIEARFEALLQSGGNAILDVGGGATSFAQLAAELPLLDATDQSGLQIIGLFATGPDAADLDYLEQFAASGSLPRSTAVVMNAGLIADGRSSGVAFEPVHNHRAVRQVLRGGGVTVMFPALACMGKVAAMGVSFEMAMNGKTGNGQPTLGMFDRMRVNRWWSREIPAFFAELPAAWLPIDPVRAGGGEAEPAAAE